jgi:hypothetical protein
MPVIKEFGGLIPRYGDHLKPLGAASRAENVKLLNGRLEPWRERSLVASADPEDLSFRVSSCCVFRWPSCVSHTAYLPDYGALYVAGRGPRPEFASLSACDGVYRKLGVPAPESFPRVAADWETGEECDSRSYVYTYFNDFLEESAPSPPSAPLTVRDGAYVAVSDFAPPPEGWNVAGIRVYRTASGGVQGEKPEHKPSTVYLRVASLQGAPTHFIDNVMTKYLGQALSTLECRLPPAGIRQISHLTGTGILAGVSENQVHFSANHRPWDWPAENDLTLPYRIVNMTTLDATVFVSTTGRAYVIDASDFCGEKKLKPMIDTDVPLPDVGCGYAHGAVATPYGMIYSGPTGLVNLKTDGTYEIVTAPWFSREDWAGVRPETVRLAYWRSLLFCVTDEVGFILSLDETYKDSQAGALTFISDRPADMTVTEDGELMMLEDGGIWRWDAGDSFRPYAWESAVMEFPGGVCPVSARVMTDGINFRLIGDRSGTFFERFIDRYKLVRLKRLGRQPRYKAGFYGTGRVDFMELGTAGYDMAREALRA